MKTLTLDEFMALPAGSVSGSVGCTGEMKLLSVTSPDSLKFRKPRLSRTMLKVIEKMGGTFFKFEGIVPVRPEDVEKFSREDVIFVAQVNPKLSVLTVVDSFQAPYETRALFRLLDDIDFEMTLMQKNYYSQIQEQFSSKHEMLVWFTEPNPATGDDSPLRYFKAGLFDWVLEVAREGSNADPRNIGF